MKLSDLLLKGERLLEECYEKEEAKASAWFLLTGVLKLTSADYLEKKDMDLSREQEQQYEKALSRRMSHEPVAYILGEWEFMGLPFKTDQRALIPRSDTEALVENAISYAKKSWQKGKSYRILDLCTGTGAIAISLAHYLNAYRPQVTATDLSEEALCLAKENARLNRVSLSFRQGDLLQALDQSDDPERFDLITCNPPYVAKKVLSELDADVTAFEPHLALYGGDDGLDLYRRLIPSLPAHLAQDGAVFLEIGDEQGEAVLQMMKDAFPADRCFMRQDLAGKDRVVCFV